MTYRLKKTSTLLVNHTWRLSSRCFKHFYHKETQLQRDAALMPRMPGTHVAGRPQQESLSSTTIHVPTRPPPHTFHNTCAVVACTPSHSAVAMRGFSMEEVWPLCGVLACTTFGPAGTAHTVQRHPNRSRADTCTVLNVPYRGFGEQQLQNSHCQAATAHMNSSSTDRESKH